MNRFLPALPLLSVLFGGSCVLIVQSGQVEEIDANHPSPTIVTAPMKAFLWNGDVVVYSEGADVSPTTILGTGVRYPLNRDGYVRVNAIPLDSVIGIEAFKGGVNVPATIGATVLGSALTSVGTAALMVALFGSCPTLYASSENGGALQAEAFSYSIASELEGKDLDRISVAPDADGVLRLELRNEALETHYINQLRLVAVEHAPEVRVVPDEKGGLLGIRGQIAPLEARDRNGRQVLDQVVAKDGLAFSSTEARMLAATSEDSREYLDLVFPRPESKTAAVLLDLRNSLLNTVLFYDLMLGTAGVQALNWWGGSLDGIGTAFEMARWYMETLGMTVQVWDSDDWHTVALVPDAGPIAWKELGVRLPVPDSGPLRVRLGFLADDWRIDRVSLASAVEIPEFLEIPAHRVITGTSQEDAAAVSSLAYADEDYLVTYPGTSAILEFLPHAPAPENATTYLLATQGYYIEWMRPEWIRSAQKATPFKPGPGAIERLMATWLEKKSFLEDAFFGSKIPVR
ncbi:MAG: hypothetical protein MUO50_14460 [Longimicrobiales bacterium]|nr:hypothetical protein [Longimicrobiales bacterium]